MAAAEKGLRKKSSSADLQVICSGVCCHILDKSEPGGRGFVWIIRYYIPHAHKTSSLGNYTLTGSKRLPIYLIVAINRFFYVTNVLLSVIEDLPVDIQWELRNGVQLN